MKYFMQSPPTSDPMLYWDPAASDPSQRRIHPLLRGVILGRDRWICKYCRREATEVDHVEPRARGGLTTPGNLVAACRSCNQAKGIRTPEEWRRDEAVERLLAGAKKHRARRRPRSVQLSRQPL